MTPEKAEEYRQVAALLVGDVDVLYEISRQECTLEELKAQVALLHELKETMIHDATARKSRFAAAQALVNLTARKE